MNDLRRLRVGISTCPNDTFTFAALLEGQVDQAPAMTFALEDIQTLNETAMRGEYDLAKVSFHAALHLARDYCVLPVGAALGFGVGPVLLGSKPAHRSGSPQPGDRVLCPGQWTTASMLYRLYCPDAPPPRQVIFSRIMPALIQQQADFGVVIHEGRFTFAERGLVLAKDLGQCWEQDTHQPLPLGGLIIRRSLGAAIHAKVTRAIRRSLALARTNPAATIPVMARYAQEFTEAVLLEHVRLYVNQATDDLGDQGRAALGVLADKAFHAGLIPHSADLF